MRSAVVLLVPLFVVTPLSFDATSRPVSTPDSTGTIAGTVVAASGGAPLAGVNVSIDSLQIGDATGPQGRFRLQNVPAGRHDGTAQFVGYSSGTSIGSSTTRSLPTTVPMRASSGRATASPSSTT